MQHTRVFVFGAAVLACAFLATAPLHAADEAAADAAGIEWYGTWERGLAEAKRSGRPILLVAAAPHCKNISGIW